MNRRPLAILQPLCILSRLQDDRLPIVNLAHLRVRIAGNDCKRIFPFAGLRILPRSPKPSHPQHGPAFDRQAVLRPRLGAVFCHSKKEPAGTMQRRCSLSLQNEELVTLSERALNKSRSGN